MKIMIATGGTVGIIDDTRFLCFFQLTASATSNNSTHQQQGSQVGGAGGGGGHAPQLKATASASTSQNSFTDLTQTSLDSSTNGAQLNDPDVIRSTGKDRADLQLRFSGSFQIENDSESTSGEHESYHETTIQQLTQHLIPNSSLPSGQQQRRRSSGGSLTRSRNLANASFALSPPTAFADTNEVCCEVKRDVPMRKCKTLPRKVNGGRKMPARTTSLVKTPEETEADFKKGILPPPPQYKGVHFAPGISEGREDCAIPTEGLPTRPARSEKSEQQQQHLVIIPTSAETVPITVRKSPGPPVLKPRNSSLPTSSSMTFGAKTDKKKSQHQPASISKNSSGSSSGKNKSNGMAKKMDSNALAI